MAVVVRMPEVLANVTEAAIQTWLVRPGEHVALGAPLAEVETEKAVVEYAAEVEGTILKLLVSEGQAVAVGEPIALLGAPGETVTDPAGAAPDEDAAAAPEPETAPEGTASPIAEAPVELPGEPAAAARGRLFASPIVRRLARERGLDLAGVRGSGPGGRIVRVDLDRLGAVPAPSARPAVAEERPAVEAPEAGHVDLPLSPMRRAIARRLTESKSTVPHFYLSAECRMDELLRLRAAVNAIEGVRVSVNDFVVKAMAGALAEVPTANAVWMDGTIRRFRGVDLAVAVALQDGLVTPVLRGADSMPIRALAAASADLAARAKAGRLRQHELDGGVATVSNLGMFGVREFSAIINPPQSSILAVGAAAQRPLVVDGALTVATMMTLTLSADHRVIDGAVAAQLLGAIVSRLEEPVRVLV